MIGRVPPVRAVAVEHVGDSAVVEQGQPRALASTPVLSGQRWRRQRHRHPRRRPYRAAARSRETAHQVAELRPRVSRIPVFRPPGKPSHRVQVVVAPLAVVGHRVERAAGSVVEHGSVRLDEGQVEVLQVCRSTSSRRRHRPDRPGRHPRRHHNGPRFQSARPGKRGTRGRS